MILPRKILIVASLASLGLHACDGAPARTADHPMHVPAAVGAEMDAGTIASAEPVRALPKETSPAWLRGALAQVTTLDEVPALLPDEVLRNFVLKHGIHRTGERGHLSERQVSQSANPDAPRAILWDQSTGTILSYNSGRADQTSNQRLDWHRFDPDTKSFALEAMDFPIATGKGQGKTYGVHSGADCSSCHGPLERPIFSMYPDWPAFYGSDNDELTSTKVAVQVAEMRDYQAFRANAGKTHPRYAPLFAAERVKRTANVPIYPTWPYRQDLEENINAPSRAFAFRPGLRLGIVLSRMQAQMLAARIQAHKNYGALGKLFVHQLLQCSSDKTHARAHASAVAEALGEKPEGVLRGDLVHYRKIWALWNLNVQDIDIRYAYGNAAYANDDAEGKPMQVGYIGRYWNSYFDGSATIDELVAFLLLKEMKLPAFDASQMANTLTRKYGQISARMAFDKPFFDAMDARASWIPIPYPEVLGKVHHRQGFPKEFKAQHTALCESLLP
jgi:hypothetical protein